MRLSQATVALAALLGASPLAAQQVKPAWSGITEELFQTYVVSEGLTALGYDVDEVSQAQIQLAHVAVANGDLTFYAAHWEPLHHAYWEESGGDENLQRVGLLAQNSLQGYLIDKKTADETGSSTSRNSRTPRRPSSSTTTATARPTSTAASPAGAASA